MSDLRSDMSDLGRICPSWGWICLVIRNFQDQKSRSGAKMMCLGTNKLTISKLDNIELTEITGAIRSNINYRNQT
jgi:hypothetical protein